MIEVYDLKKTYRDRTVLDLPALSLRQGETLALAGANGSGKTTLLRLLAGTLKPTAGTVKTAAPVLYLPQKSYAFRGTVLQNVLLGINGQKRQALDLLEKLELQGLAEKKASSLSGGELQRLSLCRLVLLAYVRERADVTEQYGDRPGLTYPDLVVARVRLKHQAVDYLLWDKTAERAADTLREEHFFLDDDCLFEYRAGILDAE